MARCVAARNTTSRGCEGCKDDVALLQALVVCGSCFAFLLICICMTGFNARIFFCTWRKHYFVARSSPKPCVLQQLVKGRYRAASHELCP